MQFGRLRSAVDGRNPHENVFRTGFGVLHKDIEIAIFVEDAGVEELIFRFGAGNVGGWSPPGDRMGTPPAGT